MVEAVSGLLGRAPGFACNGSGSSSSSSGEAVSAGPGGPSQAASEPHEAGVSGPGPEKENEKVDMLTTLQQLLTAEEDAGNGGEYTVGWCSDGAGASCSTWADKGKERVLVEVPHLGTVGVERVDVNVHGEVSSGTGTGYGSWIGNGVEDGDEAWLGWGDWRVQGGADGWEGDFIGV